jgi:hypothetical protein
MYDEPLTTAGRLTRELRITGGRGGRGEGRNLDAREAAHHGWAVNAGVENHGSEGRKTFLEEVSRYPRTSHREESPEERRGLDLE